MDPMIVVSPHLDDAVLSVGQLLVGRPDAHVVTVFTGAPKDTSIRTTFDRDSGFRNAREACEAREREDTIATRFLNATRAGLGFLDHQYRQSEPEPTTLDTDAAQAIVQQVIEVAERDTRVPAPLLLLGPLGLTHPDHHVTRRAVQLAARDLGPFVQLWLYEDLPARVLWPETVPDALAWWRGMGWDPVIDFLGTGDLDTKAHAIRIYGSQLWAPEFTAPGLHTVLVPERLYRCA